MTEHAPTQLAQLKTLSEDAGFFEVIDTRHRAFHVTRGDTLVVSFESGPVLWAPNVADALDASLLLIHAEGPTWYRSDPLFDFMDGLTDDGFFDDFDTVLFVGAGMGAYGAGAFSVAAPGAEVLLIQPIATLERDKVPWEMRNRASWALPWGPRYSYAPRSIAAANKVTVIFDPTETLDAMHASLFQASHVEHLRIPHAGPHVLALLHGMHVLQPICSDLLEGKLTPARFGRLWRARREYAPYLKGLLKKLLALDRPIMTKRLCEHAVERSDTPVFRRQLNLANQELEAMSRHQKVNT